MRMNLWRAAALAGAALIGLAGQARAEWFEARSGHFLVYSEGREEQVREFATRLERFDAGMRRLRGLAERPGDASNPLLVYVVADIAAVRRLCNGAGRPSGSCQDVAGFYQPRAGGAVIFTPRRSGDGSKLDLSSQIVLFHEYAHHFMFGNYTAAFPAWFVEGFAEFNSTAEIGKDGSIDFGRPAFHRYQTLLGGRTAPLATLIGATPASLSRDDREALYARGWLLTHYLTFSDTRQGQLAAYIKALNSGKPPAAAAETAFGNLLLLDRELDKYLRQPKLKYWQMKPQAAPTVAVRRLTPGESALMPVRLRSDRGVDEKSAKEVVLDARRLAAGFANDPGAQIALAEAEYDAGNDDLAEAAADRALAADPKNREALLYKGRARVRRVEKAASDDAAVWKEARGWFVKANRAEPDAAEPLILFYDSFRTQGIRPTANAIIGLERAYELAPQDPGLRFTIAREFIVADRLEEARVALAPLAYDPHASADNEAARLIALIDNGDKAALREKLGGKPVEGKGAVK
jgi:tetratricopeptide (TPR) repeat protein